MTRLAERTGETARRCRPGRERGIAMVVALMITLIGALIGYGIAVAARGSRSVGVAFKNQQTAFEAAVAGLERTREQVRQGRWSGTQTDFSSLLSAAANGGSLVNATSLASFGTTNGFTQDTTATNNTPVLSPATLDGASYQVFITNDAHELGLSATGSVTSTNDDNDTFMLTSFGSGPGSVGYSVAQAVYEPDPLYNVPKIPGLITMPGRNVTFLQAPTSNNPHMDGGTVGLPNCYADFALSTSAAETATINQIIHNNGNQPSRYNTCNPVNGGNLNGDAVVDNFISGTNPYDGTTNTPTFLGGDDYCPRGAPAHCLTSVSYLNSLVAQLSSVGTVCTYSSSSCIPGSLSTDPNNPAITVVNGPSGTQTTLSSSTTYYGILVVKNELVMSGGVVFHGLILAIGQGKVSRGGGGGGQTCGAMLIANTLVPDSINSALVGTPTYDFNGGGNALFAQACPRDANADKIRFGHPLHRLAFQQLR